MERRLFIQLVEKYLAGSASAEEKELLEEYYDRLQHKGRTELSPEQEADLKALMLQNILSQAGKSSQRIIPVHRRSWFRAAAAVLILGATIVGIFWLQPRKEPDLPGESAQTRAANDLAPGGNKALLTLADGSTIALDQAENGVLTAAGNADVLKPEDGQLKYRAASGDRQAPVVYNTLSTPRGGQYKLTLSDGSKVWLNAVSSIRYPTAFTGRERRVELTGEAYFEVARDTDKVFKVSIPSGSGATEIEVLGTHFNVNAYENEAVIKTTLLEGSVRLSRGNKNALLQPGQQADVGNDHIHVLTGVDVGEAIAWKNGLFQFNDADLESIMRQLERWYDADVNYENIPNLHFKGTISRNVYLSQVLKMLEITGDIRFHIVDRQIKIINKQIGP